MLLIILVIIFSGGENTDAGQDMLENTESEITIQVEDTEPTLETVTSENTTAGTGTSTETSEHADTSTTKLNENLGNMCFDNHIAIYVYYFI